MNNYGAYSSIGILALAAADNLRTGQVRSLTIGVLGALALVITAFTTGLMGLQNAALGMLTGCLFGLPLLFMGAIGRGEMRLLGLAGLVSGPVGALAVGILGLFWSSLLGLGQTAARGQIKSVVGNLARLTRFQKTEASSLHQVPFGAGLFLGSLTYIFFGGMP